MSRAADFAHHAPSLYSYNHLIDSRYSILRQARAAATAPRVLDRNCAYILNLEIAYVSQLAFKQDRRIASGDNDDDDATKEKKKENDPTKTQSSGATKST